MINRKFMAIALPLVTFATLVGSGFSAWYFGTGTLAAKTSGVGVEVTTETSDIGSLESKITAGGEVDANGLTSTQFKLILDQGAAADKADVTEGIYFTYDKTTADYSKTKVSDIFANYTISSENLTKLNEAGLKPVLKTVITITEYTAYSTYLEDPSLTSNLKATTNTTVSSAVKAEGSGNATFTSTVDITTAGTTKLTYNLSESGDIINYKAINHSGEETGKPDKTGEPQTMASNLAGVGLTFSFSVAVADNI